MSQLPGIEDEPLDPFDPDQAVKVEKDGYEATLDSDERLRQFIANRKRAYAAVFGDRDNEFVRFVVEDLAYFAKAFQAPFDPDPRRQDVKIGRLDVFWRIYEHTHLPVDTLFLRYTDAVLKQQQTGNPNG